MISTGVSILLATLLPLGVLGQGAIIGDGNVVLGVREEGFLEVDYRAVPALGLPDNDPRGRRNLLLRNAAGDVGQLFGEGWGAGIRDDNGFIDECGAHDNTLFSGNLLTNVEVERFRGSDGDDKAESRVLCGSEQLLRVRHQFRTARRRNGCEGAYEIKVSVDNRACSSLGEVIYRRNSDPDVENTSNFFTIQGTDEFFSEFATNSLFCDVLPSTPCAGVRGVLAPFTDVGPFDQGNVFQINLGELGPGEGAIFYMYYGVFDDQDAAESCLDGANINLYSFATARNAPTTYMFGFRRSLTINNASSNEDCIDFVASDAGPLPVQRLSAAAEMSDADVATLKEDLNAAVRRK